MPMCWGIEGVMEVMEVMKVMQVMQVNAGDAGGDRTELLAHITCMTFITSITLLSQPNPRCIVAKDLRSFRCEAKRSQEIVEAIAGRVLANQTNLSLCFIDARVQC
jgi:hypothetical protein